MSEERLMVVGAGRNSLGMHLAEYAMETTEWDVVTVGVQEEDVAVSIVDDGLTMVDEMIKEQKPTLIVCTVGLNQSGRNVRHSNWDLFAQREMAVNFFGPMALLSSALRYAPNLSAFVAISSNSAHIARRSSAGYCASKAALSMGLRCAARENAGGALIWGYELGLLRGTAMTRATERRFGPAQSRMIGAESGLEPADVAITIASALRTRQPSYNGVMFRLDAGEQ